jgi:hypothetical protein
MTEGKIMKSLALVLNSTPGTVSFVVSGIARGHFCLVFLLPFAVPLPAESKQ